MAIRIAVLAGLLCAAIFLPTGSAAVGTHSQWAAIDLGNGRHTASFRLNEPSGVILLYRLSAPRGTRVCAFGRIPGITVWLKIGTRGNGCATVKARTQCT